MDERPRVLYVVHRFPPEAFGGTELNAFWLAEDLSRKYRFHIFTTTRNPSLRDYSTITENFSGLEVRRLKVPNGRSVYPIDLYFDQKIDEAFERYVEEVNPSLIHIHHVIHLSTGIIELAAARHVPVVLHVRDFYYLCPKVFLFDSLNRLCEPQIEESKCAECLREDLMLNAPKRLQSIYDRETLAQAIRDRIEYVKKLLLLPDVIFCPSEFLKEELVRFGVQASKIEVHPSGVKEFPRLRRKEPSSRVTFGFLGGLSPYKGAHVLLQAFSKLDQSKVELLLFGGTDPALIEKYKAQYEAYNVKFMDVYPHEDLPNILSRLDVLVHPSICHESYSVVIHEALAAGVPVLVSDARAQKDDVEDGVNGFRFKIGDAEDLRVKMEMLLENPELLARLGKKETKVKTIKEQSREIDITYERLSQKSSKCFEGETLTQLREIRRRVEMEKNRLELEVMRFIDPMRTLIGIYLNRPDLQSAFPEAIEGKYTRLLQWAKDRASIRSDEVPVDQAEWYKENEWVRLADELDKARMDISRRDSIIQNLGDELDKARTELARRESVIENLEAELDEVKIELDKVKMDLNKVEVELKIIKESFGYHFMRFYAQKIDKLFPEGTRRGRLLKTVASSLRIIVHEGLAASSEDRRD